MIDDFGSGTLSTTKLNGQWVRLGYVVFTAVSEGTLTLSLSAGDFPIAKSEVGNIDWDQVRMTSASLTIEKSCMYVQPVIRVEGTAGETVAELPSPATVIYEGESFAVDLWVKTSDSDSPGISGGSVDVGYDKTLVTAESLKYGDVFNLCNRSRKFSPCFTA